jgi:hypothetical protein
MMGCGIRSSASATGAADTTIWSSIRERPNLPLMPCPWRGAQATLRACVCLASPAGYSGKLHLALSLPRLVESGRRARCWEAVFCSVRCEGCGWRYQVMVAYGQADQSEPLNFPLLSCGEDNLRFPSNRPSSTLQVMSRPASCQQLTVNNCS